jgi:hypothetical protein
VIIDLKIHPGTIIEKEINIMRGWIEFIANPMVYFFMGFRERWHLMIASQAYDMGPNTPKDDVGRM